MYDIATRVLKCIFGLKDDINFLQAFEDYFDTLGEFSLQNMRLDMLKAMFEEQVSNFNLPPHASPMSLIFYFFYRQQTLTWSSYGKG